MFSGSEHELPCGIELDRWEPAQHEHTVSAEPGRAPENCPVHDIGGTVECGAGSHWTLGGPVETVSILRVPGAQAPQDNHHTHVVLGLVTTSSKESDR